MDQFTLIKQSYHLIQKDFGLEGEIEFEDEENAFDRLLQLLIKQINYMLDSDFNTLLNALYRIDISENKVKEILYNSPSSVMAKSLAEVIIEREKQKVITRQQYQS